VKIINFINFKGGAGKTTTLSVVASALLARGRKVALFESDENAPLGAWRTNARAKGTWDEGCGIFPAGELALFEQSAIAADKAGYEFALVDTHGGGSELNSTVVASSTLVIIPTAITSYDVNASVLTVEFVVDLLEREQLEETVIVALLVTKLPHTLNKSREGDLTTIQDFPLFETMLRDRDALTGMLQTGLLHLALEKRRAESPIAATHFQSAMKEANRLVEEVLDIVET
jgi:chromosome partitioning protein